MKKRNLIMVGILSFLLAITALFFVVGAADINDYPDEVLGLKDGNVRVIYSATSSEKLHTKELNEGNRNIRIQGRNSLLLDK